MKLVTNSRVARLLQVLSTVSGIALALLFIKTGVDIYASGMLGHDYTVFLPRLVYGYFWFSEHGLAVLPWFVPGFCGGLPYFGDPQVMYYSLPQLLVSALGPIAGLQVSYVVFGLTGALGTYFLLQRHFAVSTSFALIGAGLFAFNEFYLFRMWAGHLSYHVFTLTPVIALLLISAARQAQGRILLVLLAGCAIAYIVHGGALNFLVPMMISVALLLVLFLLRQPQAITQVVLSFVAASVVGFLLSASKIMASYAFVRHFPREELSLAVFSDVPQMLFSVFTLFFLNPFLQLREISVDYLVQTQELRFGLSIVPLLLLMFGALSLPRLLRSVTWIHVILLVGLLIGFLIPMLLTVSMPTLGATLKQLPYFREMSLAVRWLALIIAPLVVITVVLANETLNELSERRLAVELGILVVSILLLALSHSWTELPIEQNPYNATRLSGAHAEVAAGREPPVITHIVDSNQPTFVGVDDVFADGASSQICYQALFGYQLEKYPIGTLKKGEALIESDGDLNLKNPACYMYPEENQCAPGNHFSVTEKEQAMAFLANKPFEWQQSPLQVIANYTSLIALTLVILGVVQQMLTLWRRRAK